MSLFLFGCSDNSAAEKDDSTIYGQTRRIIGFDPVATGDLASSWAMLRVYERLLQYDYNERPYKLIPLLAESMPTVSADDLTYTFKLRKGIYFTDDPCFPDQEGRELTAEDVVYSVKRLADVNTLSSGYWTVRGKIEGLDEFRVKSEGNPNCYNEIVSGLRAIDSHTLRIILKEPYPQFMWVLAMHYFSVVPREAVEYYGDDFVSHPVGTGAYILKDWQRNYRLAYARNPAWKKHGRTDGISGSAAEQFVDYIIGDGTTQMLMINKGQLDKLGLEVDQVESVLLPDGSLPKELKEQGITLHESPRMDVFYLGFNMEDPVVGENKALRQALSCAFDHETWVQFYHNQVEPLYGPVPLPLKAGVKEKGTYSYNLEKAKQLLSDAGYPNGIDPKTGRRLTLILDSSGGDKSQERQSNELLGSFMEQLGIQLKVKYSNRPTFFERVRRGDVQMFRLSWIADYSDEHNFLQLFYGANAHGCNRANYQNTDYDKLFDRFKVMQPSPERAVLAEQMVNIIMEDCPWIFLHQPIDFILINSRIKNYIPHAFPGGMEKYYQIDNAD